MSIIICTDGSALENNKVSKGYDSAGAFVIYKDGELIHQEATLLLNHTNNYAEMFAIYNGTKYVIEHMKHLEDIDEIMIITDSQLCQKSLTEWIIGWLTKATNEKLYSTTGEVKNQELIKSAYINILTLKLLTNVNVYHINSHKPESEIPKMVKKFCDKYKDISIEEFTMIYNGNKLCDELAYNKLNGGR